MHCTRKVHDDLIWVGADDRRLACFEGVYGVPDGVSYNSYLLLDEKTGHTKTITNVLGSIVIAVTALLFYLAGLPIHFDKIIIGSIMPLVPGIPITNSIRDFINGDYLSGSIRAIDALLTAFCIAVGVGIVITLCSIGGITL